METLFQNHSHLDDVALYFFVRLDPSNSVDIKLKLEFMKRLAQAVNSFS